MSFTSQLQHGPSPGKPTGCRRSASRDLIYWSRREGEKGTGQACKLLFFQIPQCTSITTFAYSVFYWQKCFSYSWQKQYQLKLQHCSREEKFGSGEETWSPGAAARHGAVCASSPGLSPHTYSLSLMRQGSLQSTRSCLVFTFLLYQPISIHSAKTRKARSLLSAKADKTANTPGQKYAASPSVRSTVPRQQREGEEGKEKERGDETNMHLTRTSVCPRAAVVRPNKPAMVSGEGRRERGKENRCQSGPCWFVLCALPPVWSLAANFLNEPSLKTPNAPAKNIGDTCWDGNRSKDNPKAEPYAAFPSGFPCENNNTDAGFIRAFNQSWMSPRAYTGLRALFKGASNSSISALVYHRA